MNLILSNLEKQDQLTEVYFFNNTLSPRLRTLMLSLVSVKLEVIRLYGLSYHSSLISYLTGLLECVSYFVCCVVIIIFSNYTERTVHVYFYFTSQKLNIIYIYILHLVRGAMSVLLPPIRTVYLTRFPPFKCLLLTLLVLHCSSKQRSDVFYNTLYPTDYSLEHRLHILERSHLRRLKRRLEERNIHVAGFYHTGPAYEFWKQVLKEQLMILDGYYLIPEKNATYSSAAHGDYKLLRSKGKEQTPIGLMAIADELFIGIHGQNKSRHKVHEYIISLNLSYADRVQFEHRNIIQRGQYS